MFCLFFAGGKMKKSFTIVILLLVLLSSIRIYRLYEDKNNEGAREKIEQAYYEAVLGKGVDSRVVGAKDTQSHTIGRIMIPTQGIDYIILEKTTAKNLDISISKVVGPAVHRKGNLVLAGHNMKNGSFFGKLKKVKQSEIIILEDGETGIKQEYTIIDKYIVSEKDLSPLSQESQSDTLITLITCTEKSDERLIVVARM
jgi:LPXTG-site transpeptidase (sortase) family protein